MEKGKRYRLIDLDGSEKTLKCISAKEDFYNSKYEVIIEEDEIEMVIDDEYLKMMNIHEIKDDKAVFSAVDKLGKLIEDFTKNCNSLGFDVLGANVEGTIELEIRIRKEKHFETE